MKRIVIGMISACFLSLSLSAQVKDTVDVNGMYSGGVEGELNTAIQTVIDAGDLSNTVFRLKSYDWYVITGTIEVPPGETLELFGEPIGNTQQSAPPQILWTASGSVTKDFMIAVYGDLIMKNIWIRYADAAGVQTGTPIVFDGDTLGVTGDTGEYGTFENCIFEWMPCPTVTASGSICVRSEHFNGTFRNCYFRNCVDSHFMYYGRAVSFPYDVPGYHTDYISFENCTFANMGYVYMQEGTNWGENVHFNHCTFYNVVMFSLESGWWWKMNVTNSLFVNTFMMGFIPAQGTNPASATITITPADSINFEVPFTDQDRHILFAHNAYYMDDWLVDWMRGGWEFYNENDPDPVKRWRPMSTITEVGCPYSQEQYRNRDFDLIPYPRPMLDSTTVNYFDSSYVDGDGNLVKAYPLMNKAKLYDIYALKRAGLPDTLNPGFIEPPINLEPLKWFLNEKWGTNLDTMWAYEIEAGFNQQWSLPENLAYTNETYLTAGMGGFPLGDLYHWWNPAIREGATDYYSAWLAQADEERETIATWLETGVHPDSNDVGIVGKADPAVMAKYTLSQNYPNPFNPTTQIEYALPVRSNITLDVFNMLGQKVTTLYQGTQKAGNHTVTFDGSGLAGGIYFYRLQSDNGVSLTKKFVLLK